MTQITTQVKDGIIITEDATSISVEGKTYEQRKTLGSKGFKWLPRSRVWTRPLDCWEEKEHGRAMKSTKQALAVGWYFMKGWE